MAKEDFDEIILEGPQQRFYGTFTYHQFYVGIGFASCRNTGTCVKTVPELYGDDPNAIHNPTTLPEIWPYSIATLDYGYKHGGDVTYLFEDAPTEHNYNPADEEIEFKISLKTNSVDIWAGPVAVGHVFYNYLFLRSAVTKEWVVIWKGYGWAPSVHIIATPANYLFSKKEFEEHPEYHLCPLIEGE